MIRVYRTETYKYKVGCGEIKIIIAYKGDESFHFILASLDNHNNQCMCAYSEALVNTLTMLIRKIDIDKEISAVIKNLDKQRCENGGIKSCPDAIGKAIKEAFVTNKTK